MCANTSYAWPLLGWALLCATACGQGVQTPSAAEPARADAAANEPDLSAVERQIFADTNAFRKQEGRDPLKANEDLSRATHYFADFMARTDKYGHTADGSEPWDRAKKYGYDYCIVEENIAYQFNSEGFTTRQLSGGFVQGWEKSPGHRKNMLSPDVVEIGVAVAHSEKSGKYYAVQLFGRPKSMAIKFSIANRTGRDIEYTVDGQSFTLKPRFTETHETCVPPKVEFATAKEAAKAETYRPKNGAQYVVRQDASGVVVVEQE